MQKPTKEQVAGLFHRLNDGGCPVQRDHGYKISPMGLSIEKIPGLGCNEMFDLTQGGTGCAIEFLLQNKADWPIDIQGCQIAAPGGVPKLSLLPAPRKSAAHYPNYRFPDYGRYYDQEWVVNSFFARRKSRLNPGDKIEGVLLASSEELIPLEIPHFARVIVTLLIFDTRGNAFPAQFGVPVDRGALIARERRNQGMASSQLR
jgi:hypothetical protein